jgi:hypothetical protein
VSELRGAAAAVVLFFLPFVAAVAVGRAASRRQWIARAFFFLAVIAALAIGHTLTERNRAGYRVLMVGVELPFAVGALVAGAAGTIAGLALGKRLKAPLEKVEHDGA